MPHTCCRSVAMLPIARELGWAPGVQGVIQVGLLPQLPLPLLLLPITAILAAAAAVNPQCQLACFPAPTGAPQWLRLPAAC